MVLVTRKQNVVEILNCTTGRTMAIRAPVDVMRVVGINA